VYENACYTFYFLTFEFVTFFRTRMIKQQERETNVNKDVNEDVNEAEEQALQDESFDN